MEGCLLRDIQIINFGVASTPPYVSVSFVRLSVKSASTYATKTGYYLSGSLGPHDSIRLTDCNVSTYPGGSTNHVRGSTSLRAPSKTSS